MANQPAVIDGPVDNTVTVEAQTIEDALARVSAEIGPDARIISAERVRRGGIGGFFAREMIEVCVEPVASPGEGVTAAFDRLLAAAEAEPGREEAEGLHRSGLPAEAARPAGQPSSPPPVPAPPPTASFATVCWEPSRFLEVGLPEALARAVEGLDPADDLGHVTAVTRTLAGVCGPLPAGGARLVGERADRLRAAVDLAESPDGHLHLVVGDDLPGSLPGVPAVVSWVSDRGAARAISLALGAGARLGYGMASGFGAPARRISAVDAALAVRDLMERR